MTIKVIVTEGVSVLNFGTLEKNNGILLRGKWQFFLAAGVFAGKVGLSEVRFS
jgi:hypothetical protein